MLKLLEVVVALGAVAGVIALFVHWERSGKEHLVVLVLLGLLVVEATLYADQDTLPRSIFHPGSGSTQVRLPEIYISLALIARLIARGKPTRIGLPAGLWLAFAAWMMVGVVEGQLYHNQLTQNLYEAKDILYIVGAYALAAGVPVRRYLDGGALYRLGALSTACASIVAVMAIAKISINMSLPALPLQNFGADGNESAALFLAIGTICFLVRLASGSVRFRHVLGLVPVVICVVLASERAVLLNLAAVVAVIGLALIIGYRHGIARRFRLTSQQIGRLVLGILAAVSAVLLVVVVPAALDRRAPRIPLVSSFNGLFTSQGKIESAQDRVTLASVAESMIHQHPLIGWGLGVKFQYYESGSRSVKTIAYAHDIVLDIWLRVGIIGVVLFVVALAVSLVGGLQVWRRHTDPVTAALALALIAVLTGLLVTAFLEPLIDEYRLATLFGVCLGMLRATVTTPLGPGPKSMFGRPELGAELAPVGGGRWGQELLGRP